MANPGGPNEIDKLSIGVEANVDLSGMDAAKAQAAARGEEIGQAAAEGIAKGSASGAQGQGGRVTGNPSAAGGAAADKRLDAAFAAAEKSMTELEESLDAPKASAPKASGGVSINALQTAIVAMLPVIEHVVSSLADSTKQQLELTQSIKMFQQSLSRSIELQQQAFDARTGGNLQVSDAMEKRKQDFEKQQAELQERLAGPYSVRDALEATAKYTIGFGQTSTTRDQVQAQLTEVEETLNSLRAQSTGVSGRERSRSTFGGALANATGIDPRSVGMGGTMSPAEAEYVRDFYTANPNVAAEQLRWSRASYQEQQNMTREMLRTGRYVPR